jgi:hypothetical protein
MFVVLNTDKGQWQLENAEQTLDDSEQSGCRAANFWL